MKKYSLLTIDLNDDVPNDKRNAFYAELAKRQWRKIEQLTTLWYVDWMAGATDHDIIETTKKDVEESAKTAKIDHYDASTAVCGNPVVWKK